MNLTFIGSDNKKYTFVHIPKTAGKSISAYIFKHAKEYYTLHDDSHATVSQIKTLNKDLGTTFAVSRNPYSRVVSLYRYLYETNIKKLAQEADPYFNTTSNLEWYKTWHDKTGHITFEKFCEQLPFVPLGHAQHPYLPVDKLFKFEELDKFNSFIKECLGTTEDLFHLNKTGPNSYRRYYNRHACKLVYKAYKKDFQSLGYSKDINIFI
jgi:hypothetical protein